MVWRELLPTLVGTFQDDPTAAELALEVLPATQPNLPVLIATESVPPAP